MLAFLTVTVLAINVAFTAGMWITWGMGSALIAGLVLTARESRLRVTMVSIYPSKLQIIRSSIWYKDLRPEEITGIEIIPSGKDPERCIVRVRNDKFVLYSEYMRSYPELIQRIMEFKGQSPEPSD